MVRVAMVSVAIDMHSRPRLLGALPRLQPYAAEAATLCIQPLTACSRASVHGVGAVAVDPCDAPARAIQVMGLDGAWRVASGAEDATVRLWDLTLALTLALTLTLTLTIPGAATPSQIAVTTTCRGEV